MRKLLALPLGGALVAASLLLPGVASAHEQRDVGKYHFVVGFLNEPAIQDQMNSIDLTITTAANKQPVTGAEKTLKATVVVGGNAASMPLALEARFGQPGKYAGYFMPTAAGSYQFHITGTLNGDPVDQSFESGPNTFDDVAPLQPLEFPFKVPDATTSASQIEAAQAAANQGRALGIAGLVVGALGLVAAGIALSRNRVR